MAIKTNRYFTTKAAAVKCLKAEGWQREDRCKDAWFKCPPYGRKTYSARVGKTSAKGLWQIAFEE
jgi:hypothetical protein